MFDLNFKIENIENIFGVQDSFLLYLIADLIKNNDVFYVADNDIELFKINDFILNNFPEINIFLFPSWDCLPYDVSSPNFNIVSDRIKAFSDLSSSKNALKKKNLYLTTINGILIKTAPKDFYKSNFLKITKTKIHSFKSIFNFLLNIGYNRVETVRELGEFSIRGSILDVFPIGSDSAFRLDFLGEEIETIKFMDPLTQRSNDLCEIVNIYPPNEYLLTEKNIENFRKQFRKFFGSNSVTNTIYEKISSAVKFEGIEHFLPLFHDTKLNSVFDFLPKDHFPLFLFAKNFSSKIVKRFNEISDFYETRKIEKFENVIIEIDDLYINEDNLNSILKPFKKKYLHDFNQTKSSLSNVYDFNSKPLYIPKYIVTENNNKVSEFLKFCITEYKNGKNIIIITEDKSRLSNIINFFEETLLKNNINYETIKIQNILFDECLNTFNFSCSPSFESFQIGAFYVISERDIFGSSFKKKKSWRRNTENFLKDVSSIDFGDLVAHIDHGVGKYDGLEKITTSGVDHDCLRLIYSGGDKLFLPVENMNLLSRVGNSDFIRDLDKLGSSNWLARKANVKKKIKDMAEKLIRVAAQREMILTEKLFLPNNYDTFSKEFPFELTEDQETAINDIISDLETGKLMDRLICGDVGFGKTEVALRASFIVANSGYQVALIAPTTILVKQHLKSFSNRFKSSNIKVAGLSRMTNNKDRILIKDGLKSGDVNIVVGTHALLSNDMSYNNLGLLIIDEEQHFGVGQKEKIKELQGNIHVLTLTATPIPRTLQLSLSGLKNLSLIATPPTNRLAVRTFVLAWDNVVLIDALKREKVRGGQTFIVCPRIKDMDNLYDKISNMVPDLTISVAHGQMKVDELDQTINTFSDGKSDILISTNIIESGIDIPNANTMIIYKSDMFGLSQLYQLRGRVGRSKNRAYAYFTIEPGKILLKKSQQRLDVIKTLDNLGAGFSLASYDMDIRGSGNLLGDEQSGQIKEVGVELYQDMLKEAVSSYKNGDKIVDDVWTPSISLGIPVLIPENYVFDLSTRMSLYRKAGDLKTSDDINIFSEELYDRFGAPPEEVNNLLMTLMIKNRCLSQKIDLIDAGPNGIVLGFKNNYFKNGEKLLLWVQKLSGLIKIRQDQKIFLQKKLKTRDEKINTVLKLIDDIELLNN